MSSPLVIVALPSKDDYVYKISSEKVPHLTLLMLGEDASKIANFNLILDFVNHATSRSLKRFGLEVDHRGVLGPDLADVLFFSKFKWSGFPAINDFRSYLLQDNNIRMAYESTTQFPEWAPHLTLGFPATPAKSDDRDYPGISYVNFDRIAVWYGDYEGVEFPLKAYDWDLEMAMSDIGKEAVDDILVHFGKLGMKWGVRKEQVPANIASVPKKTRKEAEKDAEEFTRAKLFFGQGAGTRRKLIKAKVEAKQVKDPLYAKAFNHFVKQTDLGQRASQAKNQRKRKDVTKQIKKVTKRASSLITPQHVYALQKVHKDLLDGSSKSNYVKPYSTDPKIKLRFNHSDTQEVVDDILEHVGVMGMHWGVRNGSGGGGSSAKTPVTIRDKGKKLKTSGGKGFPAHADAIRARKMGQKAKASGIKTLSNADLKVFNERLNLEANAHRLTFGEKSAGRQFVEKLLLKAPGKGMEIGGKAALKSPAVQKRIALGFAALKKLK
jgi:hypothetical protein